MTIRRALVVYESMFGNTEAVARAISKALERYMPVNFVEVSFAPDTVGSEIALLVVGAPTHAFSLSRPKTRLDAARQTSQPIVSGGRGVREWLEVLQREAEIPAAAFDTKVKFPRLPGSAAHKAEKELRRLGFQIIEPSATFDVGGTQGPVLNGELQRARNWATKMITDVSANSARVS